MNGRLKPRIPNRETVIVIHGLGGHRWLMAPLCQTLSRKGFSVRNWGYRSLWKDISTHASRFQRTLESVEANSDIAKFHIVAHSLGSIVTRVMLEEYQPGKLGRIVMLCPPNHGAHAATRFSPVFGWLSTTLTEISDRPDSFVNSLSKPIDSRYEVGIVRARSDFVVSAASTRLVEARKYIDVTGFHSSILIRARTADVVSSFLQTGSFESSNIEG